jgi:hypothetical protein
MGLEARRRITDPEDESSSSEQCSLCSRVIWPSDEMTRMQGLFVHRWCFERQVPLAPATHPDAPEE